VNAAETPPPLDCQELVEIVTEYLEGEMPPADVARFEAHLSGCAGCVEYVRELRLTASAVRVLADESRPLAVRGELLAAFRDWKARRA
jgi:anti-sigma factor RsiW